MGKPGGPSSYKLQATSHKLQATRYTLQATSYKLQATVSDGRRAARTRLGHRRVTVLDRVSLVEHYSPPAQPEESALAWAAVLGAHDRVGGDHKVELRELERAFQVAGDQLKNYTLPCELRVTSYT